MTGRLFFVPVVTPCETVRTIRCESIKHSVRRVGVDVGYWRRLAVCDKCGYVLGNHDTAFCVDACPKCGDDKVPYGMLHGRWPVRVGRWVRDGWFRGHWEFKGGTQHDDYDDADD